MSAVTTSRPASAHKAAPVLKVTQARVLVSEFTKFRTIRSSLTAVPRRLPVLWGKLAVFAGVIFSVSLVASFRSSGPPCT